MIEGDDDEWMEIRAPTITSPVSGTTGVLIAVTNTITTSVFVNNMPGITLAATDVELRTGAKGTGTLVWSSSSTLVIPALTMALGLTYYIRVRHRSTSYSSMWSDDVVIQTQLV